MTLKAHFSNPTSLLAGTTPVRYLLACLSLTMLLPSLGTSITQVALPGLTEVFGVSLQRVQWVVLAYLLTITTLVINMGRLGDLIGKQRLMSIGITLFTIASLACGLAMELWQLVVARAVQGIGAAIMLALSMALVTAVVPKEHTGRTMGLLGTLSAIGTALGPSLGGWLIDAFGWRSIFFLNLPLGFVALFLAWRYLPVDSPNQRRPRFDAVGALLLAITLAAYALAMTLGHNTFGMLNSALLLVAGLGLVLFVWVEASVKSPLIHLAIFQHPLLSSGFVASALVANVVMATLVVGPFYLGDALELSPFDMGVVMSCGPLVSALVGVPAGRLVDRYGAQLLSLVALIGMLLGTCMLSVTPVHLGIAGYVIPLVLTTASYSLFQVSNNTGVMTAIPADQSGAVSGVLNLSRNIGLISGASLMGTTFAIGVANAGAGVGAQQAAESGMHMSFEVASALIVVALAVTFLSQVLARRSAR